MATGTILVVDDEPLNLDALRQVLGQDYRLVFARNGKEALAAATKHSPSLILMDIQMPDMDGYSTCLALKSNPATESIPVIFVTSLGDVWDETTGFECGAVDYIVKPISPPVVRARVKTHLSLVQASQLEKSYHDAIHMLGKAGHYNDNDTGVHIWRMAAYARELAKTIGWRDEDANDLELAAPMHDTGKIGIPKEILCKPGKLDASEWEIMKTHTRIGHDILRKSNAPIFKLAAEIALCHHEKWEGSGYPDGLRGEAIPESARVVAVADVFDALTMRRPYKEAWPIERVVAALREGSGVHFDPRMVAAFLSILPRILEIKTNWDAFETNHDGEFIAPPTDGSSWPTMTVAMEALRFHREWKVRFLSAIANREQIDLNDIESDDNCQFGRWLHGEGRDKFGRLSSYNTCIAAHATFHQDARRVAERVNAGDYVAAKEMLSAASAYQRVSEELVKCVNLMAMTAPIESSTASH